MTKKDNGLISISLSTGDRIHLQSLFPAQTGFLEAVMIKEIRLKTETSVKELEALGVKQNPAGGVSWDTKNEKKKTIKFSQAEIEFLKKQVERFDKEKKITQNILGLCKLIKDTSGPDS